MVKNGDADLPMFITEYGWRTGDSGDHKKQEWLRQTLEMYQEPDLHFLKGAIHLCLSDFEGEPGFGLMNENLRPRESFNVFQGTPRFGASPPHTIDWKPLGEGKIEVTWRTVLPVESSLILQKSGSIPHQNFCLVLINKHQNCYHPINWCCQSEYSLHPMSVAILLL